jgi:hypothetical protein
VQHDTTAQLWSVVSFSPKGDLRSPRAFRPGTEFRNRHNNDAFGGPSTVEKSVRLASSAFALAVTMAAAPSVYAAGFGDMFNPGRWFGGNNDDDYYYDGPYGAYGPGLYGAPGYGPYGAPGYGYGYGAVPYGYAPGLTPGVAPGYAAPVVVAPATIAPAAGSVDAKDQRSRH